MALRLPFRRKEAAPSRTPKVLEDRRRRMVVTPEGVPLPFVLASRGARAAALFLDLAMIVGAMIGTTLLIANAANGVGINVSNDDSPAGRAVQALV